MENYVKREISLLGSICYYNSKMQLHRLDGPALISKSGSKGWFVNNKRHRLNGHAIDWADGGKEWHMNNKWYSKSCHNRLYLFSILEPRRIDLVPKEGD
jgi:hypothetical protein